MLERVTGLGRRGMVGCLAIAGTVGGCTDPALEDCRRITLGFPSGTSDPDVAVRECTLAAKLAGKAGEEGRSLLQRAIEYKKKSEAEQVARENFVPPTVTESWCDAFADRYYQRLLAGLTAEESKKKYSQRKTQQYLVQIVSDDAAVQRVYCKDDAGKPTDGYYACIHRSDFSGYQKCKDDERERERAGGLTE